MAGKTLYARDLTAGMNVDSTFLVRTVTRKMTNPSTRGGPKPYLDVTLADNTGTVSARVWNDVMPFVEATLVPDTVVQVIGTTQEYNGNVSVVITDTSPVEDADFADFVPSSPRGLVAMRQEYTQLADTIADRELHALLQTFIASADFAAFCAAPAAQTEVYAYRGGLLEHTLGVAQSALAIATARTDIDTDLLLAAALLHDIGKADVYNPLSFTQMDEGSLLDHAALSLIRLDRLVDMAGGVSDPARLQLFHAVASHDNRGFGQVQPQTKEAVILGAVNQLDTVLKAASTEGGEGPWTEQVRSLRRRFYRGAPSGATTDASPAANGAKPEAAPAGDATRSIWDDPAALTDDFDTEIPF